MTTVSNLAQRWDNADKWVKRVLGAFATIGTVIAIVTGITSWVTAQLDNHLDGKIATIANQIDELSAQSDAADRKLELSSTRLELNTLIAHSPDNVLEIERVARYYFIDLGGDWYMSKIYSDWAHKYGGDVSFVAHRE